MALPVASDDPVLQIDSNVSGPASRPERGDFSDAFKIAAAAKDSDATRSLAAATDSVPQRTTPVSAAGGKQHK